MYSGRIKNTLKAVTVGQTQGPETLITKTKKSLKQGPPFTARSRPPSVTGVANVAMAGADGLGNQPILDPGEVQHGGAVGQSRSRRAVTPREKELNTERNKTAPQTYFEYDRVWGQLR